MIKASHKWWARKVYELYINRQLKKNFNGIYATNECPDIPDNRPLLVTPNHISWWDGFFIDKLLARNPGRKIHLMMLEKELSRYPFFAKVGAWSINPRNPASIRDAISYSRETLANVSNYQVIYPQGEIEPFEKPVLTIKKGITLFTGNTGALILPVAFKIQHENKKLPSVYVRYGDLLESEIIAKDFNIFRNSFIQNRDKLNDFIFAGKPAGANIL